MTPRALALETIALLKPDSCQAIAEASDAGTPLRLATAAMSRGRHASRRGVRRGLGHARRGGAGCDAPAGAGEPVGSLSTVPASRTPFSVEAVHRCDGARRRRGRSPRGRQRVARAHGVAAHRLRRGRGRVAGAVRRRPAAPASAAGRLGDRSGCGSSCRRRCGRRGTGRWRRRTSVSSCCSSRRAARASRRARRCGRRLPGPSPGASGTMQDQRGQISAHTHWVPCRGRLNRPRQGYVALQFSVRSASRNARARPRRSSSRARAPGSARVRTSSA